MKKLITKLKYWKNHYVVETSAVEIEHFDTWYPLSAILSLLHTQPPQHLSKLHTPTMFMVAARGFGGNAYVDYLKDLYNRLPLIKKKMIEIDGSVYWMLSHPKQAAEIICDWFDKTL